MRLRIPLWQRLFIAFAGLSIAALATFAFLQQQDLRRGFLDYLNRLSMERISDGAVRLGQRYEATGNWDFVRGRPDELMRILGLPPPPPPRRPAFEDRNGGGGAFLQMRPRPPPGAPPPGGPMRGRPPPPGPNGFPPPPPQGQRPPFLPNDASPDGAPPFPPPDGSRPPVPQDGPRPMPPPPGAVVPVAVDTTSDASAQKAPAVSPAYVPPRETSETSSSSSAASSERPATTPAREPAPVPADVPRPPRDVEPPPSRPAGPLDLAARLLLVDASDEAVVGNPDVPADSPSVPVLSRGAVVGRLLLAPMPQLRGGLDLSFEQTQLHHAMGMAMGVLIGALLLSWQLARWLLAPVRALGQGARALVRGNYATRVPVTRSDELGALAEDFNLLAATLERNRSARQQWGADIAHELRTPIAILRGEIQALQDGIRQPGPETLASLHAECDRLAGLVDDLYQLALSDAGALVYRLEVLDLGELLRDVAQQHAGAMDDAGLDFELALPERASLPVRVDAQRMMQLFGNLLRNAIRYTNAPGRVRINVRRVANDLFVDIEDTAPGVPAEALPHLFDRLYRVDPSRSRRSGGAGLGLAICRNIAIAHGGHIVASASGMGGVCITLRLPVAGVSA